ncbi:MAG: TrkA C-terminal domain-containing protein [Candidatus Omnitrophica bacterium]|nr:TrkA C-terminal domain-containing protein [Candidatus Omnitrophota bacterium]
MNLLLFIMAIIISFIVVRIGAIAFELTGLEWSLAKFQALSCFSGTGFTTKEAELITGNPQRRRIASILMVLGNAGLITVIATFANSLRPSTIMPKFTIPFVHLVFPSSLLPWINLLIIVVSIYVIYRFFSHTSITKKLTDALRARIVKKEIIKRVTFEELLVATGGYGVSSIEVCKDSFIIGKTLFESDLRNNDITVLAVERKDEIIPNPASETRIMLGDTIICFGKLENIRNKLCVISK